ncbi:Stk1 family PASTA domain-containing Ser/Thr kinase [Actinomyces mediterranea]|uniref:Stk1 family PASTA domain-containing Ser/Thr kinase n=1 Tax=Actinomyces mediterranea TaxID=1871028 RepID=UPI0009705EC6|nr:Stk1 family PASTA domain-containing Ser/Thr kinase [Actinomyces mediterranea]
MADSARRLAGRYEVRSLIGRGGMAEVHLGFDWRLSRTVAIKMLRSDLAQDSVFLARFRREAQSAASLNHPNIVAVYDTGEEIVTGANGRALSVPYIVMEYVEGHTVKELLSDGTPVPINEAIQIVSGVLSALEYSHAQHLVHRDIKPGNIMLTNTGKVKVMDFGIARALTDSQATMTQTNAVVGTAQYLSPEQARGEQVDARSDLYSTGVVLFELLTGRPPFIGDSAVSVAYQHVQQLAPTPSSITPDVPEALDRVVMKALAKDRDERYTSAGSMMADLMRASHDGRVSAPDVAVWEQQTTKLPPTEEVGPTQTLPAAALSPSTATSTIAAINGEKEQKKKHTGAIVGVIVIAVLLIAGIWYALTNTGGQQTETVAVPANLVGMTQAEAKSAIEAAGLVFAISSETVSSEEVPEGNVAETNPASGTSAEKGSTVEVKLSSGSASVTIPDNLIGMKPEEAQAAIEALGLKWRTSSERVASESVSEGSVAELNPSAGSKVKKGETVTGKLSSGSDNVTIPDIIGMTQDQAREKLADVGLQVGSVETADDPSQEQNHVTTTVPAIGERAKKGDSVTLTLASGKVVIQSGIVGMEQAAVSAALSNLTLSATVEEQYSDTVEKGYVISVSPGEGSIVPQRSTVIVTVSKGKKPASNTGGTSNTGQTGGTNSGH